MPKQVRKRLAPAKQAPAKAPTNWVAIELQVTTTTRTYDDIGAEFGVTKGRISQKAKELGWRRGALMDRVRAKAAAKVEAKQAHEAAVEAGTEDAVEVSAVLMANTILRERKDVGRLIGVADVLMGKLEAAVLTKATSKKVEQEPQAHGGSLKREKAAAGELGDHIDNLRKLTVTVQALATLERSILGITPDTPIDPTKRVEEAVASGLDALKNRFDAIDKKHGRT